jgi:hypothetical protein
MKTIATILLALTIMSLKAQEKFSVGIAVEGFHSAPENISFYGAQMEKEFGGGAGVFFSANIWKYFSANTGINYRFITYDEFDKNVSYPVGYPTLDGYIYKQNYLTVPVNLRGSFFKNWLFVEPGIEFTWILGNENKKPQNEMLWKIGAGSKIGKLNYSLNYLWGTKEQSDILNPGPDFRVIVYKSRMIQLKVTYPLWSKK